MINQTVKFLGILFEDMSIPNWETILKAQENFAGVLNWLADWYVTIF